MCHAILRLKESGNTCSAARRIRDDLLQENHIARIQILSTSRSILHNCLVNSQDEDLDGLWDEPVDKWSVWRIFFGRVSISDFSFLSVTNVSNYFWIAVWITFCVIFPWTIICRIVDCWLKRQSFEYFYRFYQNVQRNSPLIWNICNPSLCIVHDGVLTESIHSHIIVVTFGFMFFLFRFCLDCTDFLSKLLIEKWCIVMIFIVY